MSETPVGQLGGKVGVALSVPVRVNRTDRLLLSREVPGSRDSLQLRLGRVALVGFFFPDRLERCGSAEEAPYASREDGQVFPERIGDGSDEQGEQ